MYVRAILIKQQLVINSMQSMYTNGNTNITEVCCTFGDDENGIK